MSLLAKLQLIMYSCLLFKKTRETEIYTIIYLQKLFPLPLLTLTFREHYDATNHKGNANDRSDKKNTLYHLGFNTDVQGAPDSFHSENHPYLENPVQQELEFC